MLNIYSLVSILFLAVHCQSITARDDVRPIEQPRYVYSPTSEDVPQQEQYYKATRRSERLISPSYQITGEDSGPNVDYQFAGRIQLDQSTENYPYRQPTKDYEQIIKQQLNQLRIAQKKQQPIVEQYLKEVTPTTKTAYNQREANYLRFNTQHEGAKNHEETPRTILKQSPVQYILQSDLQQKPQIQPEYQYELPEPKPAQKQYEPQVQSHHPNLVAYQNALLAHQKVIETDPNQDDSSRSSIYVSHNIPKKPVRTKISKQKPTEYENIVSGLDFYNQLQQYSQQEKLQQKQPQVFEPSPAIRYELAKPQKVEASEEVPRYEEVQYQPRPKPTKNRPLIRRPVKYQVEQPQYESPEPEHIQYQRPGPKQHPKYLPEPKIVKYQPTNIEESEPSPPEEALIKYQAAIQKYHQPQAERSSPPSREPQSKYQPEIRYQVPSRYQQYTEESQIVPQYKEVEIPFERPANIRYRPAGRGPSVAYRHSLQDSNVRYYRHLGRPVSYLSTE